MIYKKSLKHLPITASNSYVAGGAMLSILTNKPIADVDIYPKKQSAVFDIMCELREKYKAYVISITDRAISMKTDIFCEDGKRMIAQIILGKDYAKPSDIFENFDFTVCMVAFDCDDNTLHHHEAFFEDLAANRLNYNDSTLYPIASLVRVSKYRNKGFHISKSEMLKMALSVAKVGMPESWVDLAEAIGGFYGRQIELITDMDFSYENSIKYLSETDFDAMLNELSNATDDNISKECRDYNKLIDSGDGESFEIYKKVKCGEKIGVVSYGQVKFFADGEFSRIASISSTVKTSIPYANDIIGDKQKLVKLPQTARPVYGHGQHMCNLVELNNMVAQSNTYKNELFVYSLKEYKTDFYEVVKELDMCALAHMNSDGSVSLFYIDEKCNVKKYENSIHKEKIFEKPHLIMEIGNANILIEAMNHLYDGRLCVVRSQFSNKDVKTFYAKNIYTANRSLITVNV